MIKWNITSRHKPGMTTERFYYEWAVLHVALMLTNASTIRCFRRYVQHYGYQEIPAAARVLPQHAMAWESMAEHWLEGIEAIGPAVSSEDYRGRMHPHTFSDSAMELHLLQGTTIHERAGFKSGGVKLIHNLKARPGLTRADFDARFAGEHAPRVAALLQERGLRKYEIDRQLGLDPAQFKGTLFEKGGVDAYAGLEEFWFDSLEDALAIGRDAAVRDALLASYAGFVDVAASHSMYVVERVAFDFVTREATRLPAIMDPTSCEAHASYADWKAFLPALNRGA
ncbi:MAG: EthD domain-containing protein [Steroidobacteraceae bacterium]